MSKSYHDQGASGEEQFYYLEGLGSVRWYFTPGWPLQFCCRKESNDLDIIREVVERSVYFRKIAKTCMTGEDRATSWLDLGMHIGAFSSIAVSIGCSVYGFEPEASNFKVAEKNVPANIRCGGQYLGHECAVVPKAMVNKNKTCYLFDSV